MTTNITVNAHITQEIFSETLAIPVPCNTNFTPLDVAYCMEQDTLRPFKGLSLVSPSPPEAAQAIVTLPTDVDPLQLTWSAPPNYELMDAVHALRKELLDLKGEVLGLKGEVSDLKHESGTKSQQLSKLEAEVTQTRSDVVPLADAIHLRCLMDVWLHENGFGASSGSRKSWISNNKKYLSTISGIPEGALEGFFE